MLRFALAIALALPVLTLADAAHAQTQRAQPAELRAQPTEVRTAAGADFDAFAAGIRAAAEAEGVEPPTREEMRDLFDAADADNDGQLAAGEARRGNAPTRCSNRGVCHMGACYCPPARRDGVDNGLLEESESSSTAHENPLFEGSDGPATNTIAH